MSPISVKRRFGTAAALFLLAAFPGFTACGTDEAPFSDTEWTALPDSPVPDPEGGREDRNPAMESTLKITVGSVSFTATPADNAAARAFGKLLPMTVRMIEMNGNEKYYDLPQALPAAPSRPGTVRAGDLMLWGTDCLVLFYETFSTPYAYTRLGRLDDASGLASALGPGNAAVVFELTEAAENAP